MKNGSSFSVKSPRSVSWNNSGHIPNTKMDMKKKEVTEYQNFSLLCAFSQKFIWKPKVKEISCSFAVNQTNQIRTWHYIFLLHCEQN